MQMCEIQTLAAEIRALPAEAAETEYRQLRDRLREDYQDIAGSRERSRSKEIQKLRGVGGRHADKADGLEQQLEQDHRQYHDGVTRKSLLAVRTSRVEWYQIGSLRFSGPSLSETRHGSGKFDHCGETVT